MPVSGHIECSPIAALTWRWEAMVFELPQVPPPATRNPQTCCPVPETLLAFSEGMLSPSLASDIRTHLLGCRECADLYGRLERFERTSSSPLETDRYQVLREIGRGGMGIVYRAHDHHKNRVVALKLLRPEIASEANSLRLLENEVNLARSIDHPNVCRSYDFHRTSNSAFITMEYIEGVTLRERLERKPRLDFSTALRIAVQICDGLGELHKHRIVHRDLKPENVMLERNGNVKLMDFGLARRIDPEATVSNAAGTPAYMAPEQLAGSYVDDRTDIYALGLILWELFSGRSLGQRRAQVAEDYAVLDSARENCRNLSRQLRDTLLQCLQSDVGKRPRSADEIAAALNKEFFSSPGECGLHPSTPPSSSSPSAPAPNAA